MRNILFVFTALILVSSTAALAGEETPFILTLKDHRFYPERIKIPADTKVKLIVDNKDATPEEFESEDLKREKVIPGNSKGTVMIGPLKKGVYTFVGEYNETTAQGRIIVE